MTAYLLDTNHASPLVTLHHPQILVSRSIIRRIHPAGLPHPTLWSSLRRQYNEPDDYMALVRLRQEP